MSRPKRPRWKHRTTGIAVAAAILAAIFGPWSGVDEASGEIVGYALIRQDADSAFFAFAWGPATNATEYRLNTGDNEGEWTREATTLDPQVVDSMWVPLDTESEQAFVCVQAANVQGSRERVGPEACVGYTLPAALLTPGTPGTPTVTPIGSAVSMIDSLTVIPADIEIEVGETERVLALAWVEDTPTVCVTFDDGSRGWVEVQVVSAVQPADIQVPPGFRYLPDDQCEIEWSSGDEGVVTIAPNPETLDLPEPGDTFSPQARSGTMEGNRVAVTGVRSNVRDEYLVLTRLW